MSGSSGGMMGGGGMGGGGRDGWTPLGSGSVASGGGMMGGAGMMGGGKNPMMAGRGPMPAVPAAPGVGETAKPAAETAAKGKHKRTEFIILFVWNEPTPSDELMKLEEEKAPEGGGALGGSGPMGGMTSPAPTSGGGGGGGAKGAADDLLKN
jgi:hypothetical protein